MIVYTIAIILGVFSLFPKETNVKLHLSFLSLFILGVAIYDKLLNVLELLESGGLC